MFHDCSISWISSLIFLESLLEMNVRFDVCRSHSLLVMELNARVGTKKGSHSNANIAHSDKMTPSQPLWLC